MNLAPMKWRRHNHACIAAIDAEGNRTYLILGTSYKDNEAWSNYYLAEEEGWKSRGKYSVQEVWEVKARARQRYYELALRPEGRELSEAERAELDDLEQRFFRLQSDAKIAAEFKRIERARERESLNG